MHFPKIEAASRSLVLPWSSPDVGDRPGSAMGVRVTEMAGRCQRSVAGCQLPPSTRVRSGLFLGLMTMRLLAGLRADRGGLESNHSAYNQIRELQFEINRGLQPDQQFEPRFWSVSARRRLREVHKRGPSGQLQPEAILSLRVCGTCAFLCRSCSSEIADSRIVSTM